MDTGQQKKLEVAEPRQDEQCPNCGEKIVHEDESLDSRQYATIDPLDPNVIHVCGRCGEEYCDQCGVVEHGLCGYCHHVANKED